MDLKKKHPVLVYHLVFLVLAIVCVTCKKDKDPTDVEIVNTEIYNEMQDIYLWYQKLPDIDPKRYRTPYLLMDALRFDSLDRWSFVMTKTEYRQYFEQGESVGHGFYLGVDDQSNVRVAFLYNSTQAYQKGVRRSWIMKKVNGTTVTPNNVFDLLGENKTGITNIIEFTTPEGSDQTLSLAKEVIELNTILHQEVIENGDKKVGYMVFQDFIATGNAQIDQVFTDFRNQGIDELIVDLRYNGGGSISVATHLAGWIIASSHGSDIFYRLQHNDKNSAKNESFNFKPNALTLGLQKVYFITTDNSASASELLINGLEPFIDVVIVGSRTHGKPVGMYSYVFNQQDYAFFPVSFKFENALGDGNFYEGIPVDYQAEDDITKDFGDLDEASLARALEIISGAAVTKSVSVKEREYLTNDRGIYQFSRSY